jgi:hypothetical protein
MRIAFSPKRRIAAGLLLAALLSIVGYRVFRRWVSHGPEALLERADEMLWHVGALRNKPLHLSNEETPHSFSRVAHVIAAVKLTHISNRVSVPSERRDSFVDLTLTPDPGWHASILST